jgi:hypothetical protein
MLPQQLSNPVIATDFRGSEQVLEQFGRQPAAPVAAEPGAEQQDLFHRALLCSACKCKFLTLEPPTTAHQLLPGVRGRHLSKRTKVARGKMEASWRRSSSVPARYSSQTFVDAAARLGGTCSWLEGLGVRYSPTRIGQYRRIFNRLAELQNYGEPEKLLETYTLEALVNAAHEVAEVARIYEGLGSSSDPDLARRLKAALRGHALYVLDDGARSGRDFSFELVVASKIARASLPVDFGHDADVRTEFEGHEVYIECKRPRSSGRVADLISEGLAQLKKRFRESSQPANARGLLGLSIGTAVNSEFGILRAEDWRALGEAAGMHTSKFIADYGEVWRAEPDRRFLGAVIVFDGVGIVGPTEKLDTFHDVALNNAVEPGTQDWEFLLRFSSRVFERR